MWIATSLLLLFVYALVLLPFLKIWTLTVVMIGKEEDYEVNTHNSRSTAQFLLLKQNRDSSFTKEVLYS